MSGMMMAMAGGAGLPQVIDPIPVTNIEDETTTPTGASCSVALTRAGLITTTGNASSAGPVWCVPKTSIVGDGYWARLDVTAGSAPTGSATGAWLQLNSTRTWTWAQAGVGLKSATFDLKIAEDSGGVSVVGTVTGVLVSALVNDDL